MITQVIFFVFLKAILKFFYRIFKRHPILILFMALRYLKWVNFLFSIIADSVIPAQAGIQLGLIRKRTDWIPAFAGETDEFNLRMNLPTRYSEEPKRHFAILSG
jgi:hypothetical protein